MNPTDDMQIMKEEIFGPVLPVKEYENFQETIDYVNSKDRPLDFIILEKKKNEKIKF